MAVKSAVYIAVRDRLVSSNLSDKSFAEILSKELGGAKVTMHMVSYYRMVLKIIPFQTRSAIARREAEALAMRARAEETRIAVAQGMKGGRRSKTFSDTDDTDGLQELLRTHAKQSKEYLEERLAERCRVFDVATRNLWSKLDEHEKLSNKSCERIRMLEGRVTRLELQVRATASTLPNGWKIVDGKGNEIERVDIQPNGAAAR